MKRYYCFVLSVIALFFYQASYADALYSILNGIHHLESLETNIKDMQVDELKSQHDIEDLMKQVNGSVTGTSKWGTYNYHDYQSYGTGANNWLSVLQMINDGGNAGALGQVVNNIANQFPIDQNSFNRGIKNTGSQQYYLAQSQTVLASRAASQLDYDKIQDQIAYQQMLQQQIGKVNNLKSAVDLNNRIQVESNLINLAILRQAAISNQQQAMVQQGDLVTALSNAKFLTKP